MPLADELATNLATQAAQDPRVQAAARNAAQEQATQAAQAGKAAYCKSWGVYIGLLKTKSIVDGRFCGCQQEEWAGCFEYWNITWMRMQTTCLIVYVLWSIVAAIAQGKIPTVIMVLLSSCVYFLWCCALGHLSWYCVVQREGCCGNVGYFIWGLFFLLTAFGCLFDGKVGHAKLVYLLLLIPTVYLSLACWKLGAGNTARGIATSVRNAASSSRG